MGDAPAKLCRQAEAVAVLDTVTDLRTKNLVRALITSAWLESQRRQPAMDFDMEFFVRSAIACCQQHELLQSVLAGEYDDDAD